MPDSIAQAVDILERLADYNGPWRALRHHAPLLRQRVTELRERAQRLDDVLVVALVGGSGVGKSTLLNALAGDQIAPTSEMRPCTATPMAYYPPGVTLPFSGWPGAPRSALENLALIDTPDSDTVVRQHRTLTAEVLAHCDLILLCGSPEKYLDDATWSLLRPLQGLRSIVCVETKAFGPGAIKNHWMERLRAEQFAPAQYFRVNALHAFDRKLRGGAPTPGEFEFPALENFLREELTRERISRIKRSNAAGLLMHIINDLAICAREAEMALATLEPQLREEECALASAGMATAEQRLLGAKHLWLHAVYQEMAPRAKGLIGALFRTSESMRTFPARLPGLFRADISPTSASPGTPASPPAFDAALPATLARIRENYQTAHGRAALALTRAGFEAPGVEEGLRGFESALEQRLGNALAGPIRDRLVRGAQILTSWPLSLLADAPPAAFLVHTGCQVIRAYFTAPLLQTSFFFHAIVLLAILAGVELAALSLAARGWAGWARRRSLHDVRAALAAPGLAFAPERAILADTRRNIEQIHSLTADTLQH